MRKLLNGLAILLAALLLWAGHSEHPAVWPIRNTLEYQATRLWWKLAGEPDRSQVGSISGRVVSTAGIPLEKAVVVVSEWDGRVHAGWTDATGRYRLDGLPAGNYRAAVAATGFASKQSDGLLQRFTVRPGGLANISFCLEPDRYELKGVPARPQCLDRQTLSCTSPVPGSAVRTTLQFAAGGRKEPVLYYRPQNAEQPLPVLLTVYPGPVDTWECVSIGLSQAGYAVLAVGPQYSLDLADDVAWLTELLAMIKRGELPGADPVRVAALGGSYSALLLELVMLRDRDLSAVVLLGPPADMFDFRRRYEREGFVPPFGLDQALVALGLPSREPLRYLKNSMVYHVRPDLPATILFHSYQDEIVPFQQSSLLAASLRAAGVEAELHLFDGASHYLLADGDAAQTIYQRTIDFLSRHGMSPFPAKERKHAGGF